MRDRAFVLPRLPGHRDLYVFAREVALPPSQPLPLALRAEPVCAQWRPALRGRIILAGTNQQTTDHAGAAPSASVKNGSIRARVALAFELCAFARICGLGPRNRVLNWGCRAASLSAAAVGTAGSGMPAFRRPQLPSIAAADPKNQRALSHHACAEGKSVAPDRREPCAASADPGP